MSLASSATPFRLEKKRITQRTIHSEQLETNSQIYGPIALSLSHLCKNSFFKHQRPQYTSLRYALTIRNNVKHMSYFQFEIAKSKLLNELADGLTRLLKLPRLFIFYCGT
jgi:hypothetical protein